MLRKKQMQQLNAMNITYRSELNPSDVLVILQMEPCALTAAHLYGQNLFVAWILRRSSSPFYQIS